MNVLKSGPLFVMSAPRRVFLTSADKAAACSKAKPPIWSHWDVLPSTCLLLPQPFVFLCCSKIIALVKLISFGLSPDVILFGWLASNHQLTHSFGLISVEIWVFVLGSGKACCDRKTSATDVWARCMLLGTGMQLGVSISVLCRQLEKVSSLV